MTMYSLVLAGRTKRSWQAAIDDTQLSIVAGPASKLGARSTTSFRSTWAAQAALVKAMLAKLRAGYALTAPVGALVGLLGLRAGSGCVGLAPDGATVWQVLNDASGHSTLRIYALATGVMLAEHALGAHLGVRDLWVRADGRALLATEAHGVLDLGPDGASTSWSEALRSTSRLEVARDRVVAIGGDAAVLLDARSAEVIARIADVQVAALSADGARLVVAGGPLASEIRVLDARTGDEQMPLSLGKGRGVSAVAISRERVVATSIWFEGAQRYATWCWSLADGERTLTKRFANENNEGHATAAFGADDTLLALARSDGILSIFEDSEVRLDGRLLGRTTSSTALRGVGDGRWLLGSDRAGMVAVWDFERVRAGVGINERAANVSSAEARRAAMPRVVAVAIPRTALEPTPFRAGIEQLTLPLGRSCLFSDVRQGGAIYASFAGEHSTWMDLSSWPPAIERRAQIVIAHARGPNGQWLILDRDGLWLTETFAVQGTQLTPPFSPSEVGWLREAPVVFDRDGAVAPQVHTAACWTPITGLVKADARGGTGVINLGNGVDLVSFRGVAYRVDAQLHATRVLDLTDFAPSDAVALPDGRFALHSGQALCLLGLDGVRTELGDATQNKRSWGHYMLGLQGGLLVSFASWRESRTFAGAYLDLVTDEPVLIEHVRFGVADDERVAELFACEDRILARIDKTETLRAIPWPLAPPIVRVPRRRVR